MKICVFNLMSNFSRVTNFPMFEMFDGVGNPKSYLRNYCDKLVGVGVSEKTQNMSKFV